MKEINGIEYPEELLEWLQPGNVIRTYPTRPLSKEVLHILAIVEGDQAVVKSWWKHKQRWHYRVTWFYVFKYMYNNDTLELVKKGKPANINKI